MHAMKHTHSEPMAVTMLPNLISSLIKYVSVEIAPQGFFSVL